MTLKNRRLLLVVTAILLLIFISILPGTVQASQDKGDPWPKVLEEGSGTIKALYVPAEGFAYKDESGKLTGVTVELLREFVQFVSDTYEAELDIVFEEEESWSRFYQRVVDGQDGLIGFGNVTITEERRSELAFSPSYMTNIASLVTHENAPELEAPERIGKIFSGRDALAFEGTLHEKRVAEIVSKYHPGAEIIMAHSNAEIIEKLSSKDAYYAYIDLYNYWRAREDGAPLQRHTVADESAEEFGYIMPLKSTWEPVVKQFFGQNGGITQTEKYRDIMKNHLGTELAGTLMNADNH